MTMSVRLDKLAYPSSCLVLYALVRSLEPHGMLEHVAAELREWVQQS